MPLHFRNVDAKPSDPVRTWPYEALVTSLERGLVPDWQPILAEIAVSPWGRVARDVEHYLTYCDIPGIVPLFTLAIARARARSERNERDEVSARVRAAVAISGLTAAQFAAHVGTSASRLSTYCTGAVVPSASMLVRIERMAAVNA